MNVCNKCRKLTHVKAGVECGMSPGLGQPPCDGIIIETIPMTKAEQEAQKKSFAEGNLAIDRSPDSRRTMGGETPTPQPESVTQEQHTQHLGEIKLHALEDALHVADSPVTVLEQRGATYGPNPFNQETVATQWQAILESHFQQKLPGPIPPHIVGLMMVGLKLMRAATPFGYNDDNYTDGHNYLDIAKFCDPRAPQDWKDGHLLSKIAKK